MPDRDERRNNAARHLALMRSAFATETEATIAAATIYEDGEGRDLTLPEPAFDSTEVSVTTQFVPTALRETTGKATVIDPAAFTRPGGGYEDGAFGPEQVLCAESNLYPILCGMKKAYHAKNRGYQCGQLYTDRTLYLPDVVFVYDGDVRTADVIAVPEPNRTRAITNHRSERECDYCLASRIETMLNIAAVKGCEVLVCGAFGCGREGFPARQVAELFANWVDENKGAIQRIVFAVPRMHASAFDTAFGITHNKKAAPDAASKKSDTSKSEDDFDVHNIDLPEGVTLR